MPIVKICDADGKTILHKGEEHEPGWGYDRVYSSDAILAVDAYAFALQQAAIESRKLFAERREAAVKAFHVKYPEGKLPDEEDMPDDT